MLEHSRRRPTWRRWIFRVWIGLACALALYVIAMLPFVRDERIGHFLLAVPVPLVMMALLAIGLGWLVWLVTARRQRQESGSRHHGRAKPERR